MTDTDPHKSVPLNTSYRSVTQQFNSSEALKLKQQVLNRRSQLITDGEIPAEEEQLQDPLRDGIKNYRSMISDNMSASVVSGAETQVAWSDAGYAPKKGQDEGVKFLGIYGKPGIKMGNLAAIPLLLMLAMFADTDILQSILYLLKSPPKDSTSPGAFYGLTTEEAKNVATASSTYATFVSLAALLGSGFLFDMMGRRPFLIGCFGITAVITILFPVLAPSIAGFTCLRIVFQCLFVPIIGNPLVTDYVQVQFRGRATAMQNQGALIGNLLSVSVLFTLTDMMVNQYLAYSVMALLQILAAFVVYKFVSEPDIMNAREEKRMGKKSCFGKICSLLRQTWKAARADSALMVGLILCIVTRNQNFVQQVTFQTWLQASGEAMTPPMTEEKIKKVWQVQNLTTNLCALPILFLFARRIDTVSAKIMIPLSFIFQIVVMVLYMFVPNPEHWSAYFCAVFQAGSGMVLIVTTQSYVAKRTPKMIRGMIMGVLGLCSSVGVIIYLQLVRWMIPTFVGYNWCFGFVAGLDILMLIFCLAMIAAGKFGMTAPHEDEAVEGGPANSENNNQDNEHDSQCSMDDGEGSGGFPMGEIYEADSDDEQTNAPESLRFNSQADDGGFLSQSKAGDIAQSQRRNRELNALATSDDPLNMMNASRNSRERAPSYARIDEDIEGENNTSILMQTQPDRLLQTEVEIAKPEDLNQNKFNINASEMASQPDKGMDFSAREF